MSDSTLPEGIVALMHAHKLERAVLVIPDEHDSNFEIMMFNTSQETLRQFGHFLVNNVKDTRGPLS